MIGFALESSYTDIATAQAVIWKTGDHITEKEMIQKNIEEFARLQNYMIVAEKESESYKRMKDRYIELKVILTASGINLTELDKMKE